MNFPIKNILKRRKNSIFFGILIVASFLLSLTPLYSIGYLVFIVAVHNRFRFIEAFRTRLSGFIISLLIFTVTIMVAGMITSYFNIQNTPPINLVVALGMFAVLIAVLPRTHIKEKVKIADMSDALAIITALVVPVIILFSFIASSGYLSGLFAAVNQDGWDNSSHINLLQVIEKNHNYFYSTSPETVNGQKIYNNYPQGWHLASAHITDGVIPRAFSVENHGVSNVLLTYLVVVFVWYFLAVYTFVKSICWLLVRKKQTLNFMTLWSVFVITQLPILTVFVSSLCRGYQNYLGVMPLVIVASVLTYQYCVRKKGLGGHAYLALMGVLTAGVGLVWVLPSVPIALMGLLAILGEKGVSLKKYISLKSFFVLLLLMSLGVVFLLYIAVLRHDINLDQMDVGGWLNEFPSLPLVAIVLVAIAVAIWRRKLEIYALIDVLLPFLLFLLALWGMLCIKDGTPGYYHAKMVGITFVVAMLIIAPVMVRTIHAVASRTRSNRWYRGVTLFVLPLAVVGSIFIFTEQNTSVAAIKPQLMTEAEQKYIESQISTNDYNAVGQLLILREKYSDNVNRSMLFNRLDNGAASRFLSAGSPSLADEIDSAETCLMNYPYVGSKDGKMVPRKKVKKNLTKCLQDRRSKKMKTTILMSRNIYNPLKRVDTEGTKILLY